MVVLRFFFCFFFTFSLHSCRVCKPFYTLDTSFTACYFFIKNNCLTLVNDSDTPQFTNKHLHLSCTELLQLLLQEIESKPSLVLLILIDLPLNFAY